MLIKDLCEVNKGKFEIYICNRYGIYIKAINNDNYLLQDCFILYLKINEIDKVFCRYNGILCYNVKCAC